MTSNETFIIAARKKLRFDTTRGQFTVEDLYDLNLESLDRIAVALDAKVSSAGKKSFIGKRDRTAADESVKFEIVKFIIETRLEEVEKSKARTALLGQKAFLQDLLERKRTAELETLPVEEIQKKIAALEADEPQEDAI